MKTVLGLAVLAFLSFSACEDGGVAGEGLVPNTVSLKYVVYQDRSGTPVVSQAQALANLATINQIWAQCKIAFQIGEFLPSDPGSVALNFDPADETELDQIRQVYDDSDHFLVVTTGAWNRTGTLGSTEANAWTKMPGDGIYGSILEQPVGTYPNVIAHELGHYMNLLHFSDATNLMNPVTYDNSTQLTEDQCATSQAALTSYWPAMRR